MLSMSYVSRFESCQIARKKLCQVIRKRHTKGMRVSSIKSKRLTMAAPIPREPPVTSATLPVSLFVIDDVSV